MPDAIITSTESTFGTISGTFAADQSTISGTILGPVAGNLSGSVGVPGPAGPGVPAGGLEGQIIVKASDTDYDTVWVDNAAETLTATVRNETGATLTKGTVVYINGAAGNKATVTKASASSESASSKTFAILSANIPNNQNGQAVTVGLLKGVDTSAFSPGANLWLSTTAGQITQTPPTSPNHAVFLGNAVRIHANQGEIEVRIQNGYELGELHDVLIHDVANGQVLKYDSAQGLWVNGTDVGGVAWGGITGTLSDQTDLQTALDGKYSTSNPAGYITSSALTGYATESFVTSQGYITSSALSPYLLSSTAASTYAALANATFTGVVGFNGASGNVAAKSTGYFKAYTSGAESTDYSLQYDTGLQVVVGGSTVARIAASGILAPSAGITFSDASVQTTAFTGFSGYATESWVTSQGYITSSALTPYATLASPALTGNVTITTNSASPALFITQTGTGNILTLHDQAADTTFVAIDQNGKVNTIPSVTASAGFNVPHGSAPSSPVNGDIWTTTGGIFWRQNGTTQQAVDLGGTQTISGIKTFSASSLTFGSSTTAGTINIASGAVSTGTKTVNIGTAGTAGSQTNINIGTNSGGNATATVNALLLTRASATTGSGLRVPHGTAPTSPTNGDIWTDTAGIYARINGATQTLVSPALASLSEARQFTNDTKVMSPRDVLWSMLSQDFIDIDGGSMTTTNTGTITSVQIGQLSRSIRPGNAGACSSRIRTFGVSQVDQTWTATSRAQPSAFLNFSLRSIHSGRSTTSGVTDANYTCAVYYGKAEADGTGDLIRRGYGWKMVGGAGSRFLQLQAHNGTTLSSVTSSFAVTAGVAFDWDIESDGAGNVTLYVNGSSVATSTGGPTGSVNITGVAWQEEVVAAAALSSPFMDFTNSRGRFIVINSW